jgi:hypothetical protein
LLRLRLQTWIEAGLVTLDEPVPEDGARIVVDAAALAEDFEARFSVALIELI